MWVNLAQPDPYLVLPILVAGTMFLQQKLMAPPKDDSKDAKKKAAQDDNPAAQMQQSMLYTMPLMFGFFAMSFGSGLAIARKFLCVLPKGQKKQGRYYR